MSGEKIGKWRLADPGDATAMSWDEACGVLAEYEAKAERLREQLEALKKQNPGLSVKVGAGGNEPPPTSGEELVSALTRVQDLHNLRYFELQRVEAVAAQQHRFSAILNDKPKPPESGGARQSTEAYRRWQKLRDGVPEAVAKLLPGASNAVQAEVEKLAREALGVRSDDVERLERLSKQLVQLIGDHNKPARGMAEERRRHARDATALLIELKGAGGGEARAVVALLEEVQSGKRALNGVLEARAKAAIAANNEARAQNADHRQARARDKAAEIIASALKDLGYGGAPRELKTAFSRGGETLFQKPGWGSYFCRLRVDPETQSVDFRIVCEGDAASVNAANRALDRKMEEAWCSSFSELEQKLKKQGVSLEMSRRTPAGKEIVERIAKKGKLITDVELSRGGKIGIGQPLP
jgi:hypothetical protein